MGQALYRKYRSRSLDEIVGQSHITAMLARAIANDRVAHAYLLTGPRGVGKTSIARILAHEINGLPYTDESIHLDIIEIDAASNNSVEDVRDLREKVQIAPASAKRKIYIIDEVHMLSKSAFNALLKTLEEPPEHAVFILATTDADKLPATIISRVQRFNFRAISPSDAAKHLRFIADNESIEIDDDALALIARHGRGSFRDSIGLLDQLQNLSDDRITTDLVRQVLGLAESEIVEQLLSAYQSADIAKIVQLVDQTEMAGTPASVLTEQLIHAVSARIATDRELLPLLDALLDVSRSAWPHVKLLTALSLPVAGQQENKKSVGTAVSEAAQADSSERHLQPESLPMRTRQRPGAKPSEEGLAGQSSGTKQQDQKKRLAQDRAASPESTKSSETSAAPSAPDGGSRDVGREAVSEDFGGREASENSKRTKDQPFPWQDFLTHIKSQKATGAHSLLGKCGYAFDGTTLTIYAGKKFNKTQLDKALPTLSQALAAVGVSDGAITVLETSKPPKDGQAAAILAMMGGGEEVTIDGE